MQEPISKCLPKNEMLPEFGRQLADKLNLSQLDSSEPPKSDREKSLILANLIQSNHQVIVEYLRWKVSNKEISEESDYYVINNILDLLYRSLYNEYHNTKLRALATNLIRESYPYLTELVQYGREYRYWASEFWLTATMDSHNLGISPEEVDTSLLVDFDPILTPTINRILLSIHDWPQSEKSQRLLPHIIDFFEKIQPLLIQNLYSDTETIRFSTIGVILLIQSFEPIIRGHPLISDTAYTRYKQFLQKCYEHRKAVVAIALSPEYNEKYYGSIVLFPLIKLFLVEFFNHTDWSDDPDNSSWLENEFDRFINSNETIQYGEKERALAALLSSSESNKFGIKMLGKYLARYGYEQQDIQKLLQAWKNGTNTNGFKTNFVYLVRDNLLKIKDIEEDCQKGASLWLHHHCGIRHFARYPTQMLVEQFNRDGSDKETTTKRKTPAIIMTAIDDHNQSFYSLNRHIRKLDAGMSDGFDFAIYEYANSYEAKEFLGRHRHRFGRIGFLMVSGHGDQEHFNKKYDASPGEMIRVEDVLRGDMSGRKRHFFTKDGIVLLNICSSAGEPLSAKQINLAQAFSDTYQVPTIGPTAPAAIHEINARLGSENQPLLEASHSYPLGTKPETYEVRPARVMVPRKRLLRLKMSTRV